MAPRWIELVTGPLEEKKQYREAKARIKRLPANYRAAAEAVERYLMYVGGTADGRPLMLQMVDDLADLFEREERVEHVACELSAVEVFVRDALSA